MPNSAQPPAPKPAALDHAQLADSLALETTHVRDVYDEIAAQWHATRYKAWPKVVQFVQSLPPRSLVADLGCGNGKLAPAFRSANHLAIGCDFSAQLCRIATLEMKLETQVADVLLLPYKSNTFDAAVSIAVLHHISSVQRRQKLIAESMRILRPGGRALFYAWALEQKHGVSNHLFESQDVFVSFTHRAQTAQAQDKVLQRYCHVYRRGELSDLVRAEPSAEIEQEYHDTGNWCVVAVKRHV